jgi:hypothetical protein
MLYNACNDLLQQFLEAVNKANSFQTGYTKHLTVGYCASRYPYHVGSISAGNIRISTFIMLKCNIRLCWKSCSPATWT